MVQIVCYLENYEHFGIFLGAYLSTFDGHNLREVKKSVEFYNGLGVELETFLATNEFTVENISNWFCR